MQRTLMNQSRFDIDIGYRGVFSAALIMAAWVLSLGFFATRSLGIEAIIWIPFAVWLRTFLNVGLFISAHDAMHGTLYPKSHKVNHGLGALAVALYAGFSYGHLLREHHRHHNLSGTLADPDFADSYDHGFFRWFFAFMVRYCSVAQFASLTLMVLGFFLLGVSPAQMLLFWALPSILSAVQLFYFGTYRPHRIEDEAFEDEHRARSSRAGNLYSFLTCYHFGYHLEHHRYPWVPWWALPRVREEARPGSLSEISAA